MRKIYEIKAMKRMGHEWHERRHWNLTMGTRNIGRPNQEKYANVLKNCCFDISKMEKSGGSNKIILFYPIYTAFFLVSTYGLI